MELRTIVVLSGCPAAGKSTLLKTLKHLIQADVLEIDEILNEFPEFSPENYHEARRILVRNTEEWIRSGKNSSLIIEDTNHLKSLVKPFRLLCKAYRIGFSHLILDVELELAIERNRNRENKVPLGSLEKIFAKLSSENFFKESLVIKSGSVCCDDLLNCIRNAKVFESEEFKGVSKEGGFKHMLDCKIRKIIKVLVDKFEGNKKPYAKLLIETKRNILRNTQELSLNTFLENCENALILLQSKSLT